MHYKLDYEKGTMRSDNKDELLPIVDTNGTVIGTVTRGECHNGDKILHPVVHLHILDNEGRIYLQQRPLWKEIQPGKWDTAVGGHVSAGENIESALKRETLEEVGIKDFQPEFVTTYLFESEHEKELIHVYKTNYTGEIRPSEELDGGRFWSIEEIESTIGRNILTPNFEQEFQKIRNIIL